MGERNFGYLLTGLGICKLISVLLGAISVGLLIGGYRRAGFFQEMIGDRTRVEVCTSLYKQAVKKGSTRDAMKPCPEEWLVLAPLCIMAICFLLSLFSFIVLLFLKLNKNGLFNHIDMVFHILAGFILVIVGFFLVAYVGLAFNYELCDMGSDPEKSSCQRKWWKKSFRVWTFLSAAGITLLTGCAYFSIGTMIQRKR